MNAKCRSDPRTNQTTPHANDNTQNHQVLKASDPLIFSIGWRRFQSMCVPCCCYTHSHT
jgi:hypothetical protein